MFLVSFFLFSSPEAGAANTETEPSQTQTVPSSAGVDPVGKPVNISGTISTALANAGHTLEGSEAELVLSLLRLAFETKNLKILESALDCLHVRSFLTSFFVFFFFFFYLFINNNKFSHFKLCRLELCLKFSLWFLISVLLTEDQLP